MGNLTIFKNFWNWISTFRQSILEKKLNFELNLITFKLILSSRARSAQLGKTSIIDFEELSEFPQLCKEQSSLQPYYHMI